MIAIVITLPVLLIGLVLAQPRGRVALRLTTGFIPLQEDTRVFYEPGAEEYAKRFADALPSVVNRVEDCQSLPFESEFRVYVCSSHESFTRHIGQPVSSPVRGIAFLRDIWVSPKAFAFYGKDTHWQTLAHELSHLHLGQHLGWWHRTKYLPNWFLEGLADWVADTGGEIVSREEALEGFRTGRHLVPATSGKLRLSPPTRQDLGVSWPIFHMQSRIFIEYLLARGEEPFSNFIAAVLGGVRFNIAFEEHFGNNMEIVWQDFINSVDIQADEVNDTPGR